MGGGQLLFEAFRGQEAPALKCVQTFSRKRVFRPNTKTSDLTNQQAIFVSQSPLY